MPLDERCWSSLAFISFRGIYEWKRDFFQKSMSVHILSGPLYRTCEVYIDDLLFHGQDDEDFLRNARDIFQICREKGVILSAKKLVIGMERVTFVGHDVDSQGLNMTAPRIASAIAFKTPETLKELSTVCLSWDWLTISGTTLGTTPHTHTTYMTWWRLQTSESSR